MGRYEYWQNELRSLGIEAKCGNELTDTEELAALANNMKQVYFQDYKTAYGETEIDRLNFEHII